MTTNFHPKICGNHLQHNNQMKIGLSLLSDHNAPMETFLIPKENEKFLFALMLLSWQQTKTEKPNDPPRTLLLAWVPVFYDQHSALSVSLTGKTASQRRKSSRRALPLLNSTNTSKNVLPSNYFSNYLRLYNEKPPQIPVCCPSKTYKNCCWGATWSKMLCTHQTNCFDPLCCAVVMKCFGYTFL